MRKNSIVFIVLGFLIGVGLVGCAGGKKLITSTGIHNFKLGDQMPPTGVDHLGGRSARDTFELQGEYQWRQVVLEYRKGNVYLEEDFFGSDYISRVRVYTPELALRNGLRVGMQVSDLQVKANDWTIVPLPDYNLIDLYSRTMPRIHFLIDDPAVAKDKDWSEYKIEQLAPAAPIKGIVVF
jgi:hypothetical protein